MSPPTFVGIASFFRGLLAPLLVCHVPLGTSRRPLPSPSHRHPCVPLLGLLQCPYRWPCMYLPFAVLGRVRFRGSGRAVWCALLRPACCVVSAPALVFASSRCPAVFAGWCVWFLPLCLVCRGPPCARPLRASSRGPVRSSPSSPFPRPLLCFRSARAWAFSWAFPGPGAPSSGGASRAALPLLLGGGWWVVSGGWWVVRGRWFGRCGWDRWCVVRGVVCGVWCVVCGVGCVARGA